MNAISVEIKNPLYSRTKVIDENSQDAGIPMYDKG